MTAIASSLYLDFAIKAGAKYALRRAVDGVVLDDLSAEITATPADGGTIIGSITPGDPNGTALQFADANNDRAEVSAPLLPAALATSWWWQIVFRCDDAATRPRCLYGFDADDVAANGRAGIWNNANDSAGQFRLGFATNGGSQIMDVTPAGYVTDGKLCDIILSCNAANTVTAYAGGVLVGTATLPWPLGDGTADVIGTAPTNAQGMASRVQQVVAGHDCCLNATQAAELSRLARTVAGSHVVDQSNAAAAASRPGEGTQSGTGQFSSL